MDMENNYNLFLSKLRKLRFCRVSLFVAKRNDLISFIAKDGKRTNITDPWFGDARAQFTEKEWENALAEYNYYYGRAEDNKIFFCKRSRTDHSVCFLPTHIPVEHRYLLPKQDEFIFGQVDEEGSMGPRFDWWDIIEEADVRLVGLLLGTMTFSQEKIEKKLTIARYGCLNKIPFLMAKAFYFRDVDYFVDLSRKREPTVGLREGESIYEWLYERTVDILPEFWKEFESKMGKRQFVPKICHMH